MAEDTARITSKKRKLPRWMTTAANGSQPTSKGNRRGTSTVASCNTTQLTANTEESNIYQRVKQARRLPDSFYQGLSDSKLPFLQYTGRIYYCYHKDDCNFICADLRTQVGGAFGFDIEWRVSFVQGGGSRKTSLLQLCPDSCVVYLLHLSCMNGFPSELKALLEDENILKVGVGIAGDMSKLAREFDVQSSGIVDLSILANEKKDACETWSLTGLVMNLFKTQLNKDHRIRCSNWEQYPLTEDQKQYAASDAYAAYIIYNRLVSMETKSEERRKQSTLPTEKRESR